MRYRTYAAAIICALAMSTATAEDSCEQFTLKDGRTLVGSYDDFSQTLTLAGDAKAVMHIDRRDIVARAPAEPPKPKVKAPKPEAAAPPQQVTLPSYMDEFSRAQKALSENDAEYRRLTDTRTRLTTDLEIARKNAIAEFWRTANYEPVVLHLPAEPSQAELQAAIQIKLFNEELATRRMLKGPIDERGDAFLEKYAKYKNDQVAQALCASRGSR